MVLSLKNYKWVNKCLRLSCESRFCTYRFRNDIDAYLFWSTGFYFERISLIQGFLKGGGVSTINFNFQRGVPPSKCVMFTFFWQDFFYEGGGGSAKGQLFTKRYTIYGVKRHNPCPRVQRKSGTKSELVHVTKGTLGVL